MTIARMEPSQVDAEMRHQIRLELGSANAPPAVQRKRSSKEHPRLEPAPFLQALHTPSPGNPVQWPTDTLPDSVKPQRCQQVGSNKRDMAAKAKSKFDVRSTFHIAVAAILPVAQQGAPQQSATQAESRPVFARTANTTSWKLGAVVGNLAEIS